MCAPIWIRNTRKNGGEAGFGGVNMKYTAAILTVSDRCSRGVREDTTGPALAKMLTDEGLGTMFIK